LPCALGVGPQARLDTSMTDRKTFLERVRRPLNRAYGAAPGEARPVVDEAVARLVGVSDDLTSVFIREARASGMLVHESSAATLGDDVLTVLREAKAKRIALACEAEGLVASLQTVLKHAGLTVLDGAVGGTLDQQFDCDAGLSDVVAAIAETGTLVYASSTRHSRGPSLIPPMHLAVVRREQIVADLLDYFGNLQSASGPNLPSSVALITGPSKTADIEGILVTGVHGPGTVHIFVV